MRIPVGPSRYRSSVNAWLLCFESFAIEYETVKPRFPRVLFRTIGYDFHFTLGYCVFMASVTQLPSKMIEAFSRPRPSPHQLTPSCVGVWARPLLSQPMYVVTVAR